MPRPDGRLYESEKPKAPAKAQGAAAAKRDRLSPGGAAELAKVVDKVAAVEKLGRRGPRLTATPERIAEILRCIRGGLSIAKAVQYVGVTPEAVDKWLKVNETLSQLFAKAEMDSEMELVGYLQAAAKKDHKAAAWLLERRHSWILSSRTEHTGKDGGPMQVLTIHKDLMNRVSAAPDPLARARPVNVVATEAK